jgi:type IV fimbrial biogenesis protein FimT
MLMPAPTSRVSGFTLIELVVTLAIFAVLALLGIPSFQQWIKEGQIRTTAESIKSGLSQARQLAIKSNSPMKFTLSPSTDMRWNVTDPSNAVLAKAVIEGGVGNVITVTPTPPPTPPALFSITFTGAGQTQPGSINANCPTPGNPGSFLDNSANCTGSVVGSTLGGGSGAQFKVTNSVDASVPELDVTVSPGGQIRTCDPDPSLPAGDPRKC